MDLDNDHPMAEEISRCKVEEKFKPKHTDQSQHTRKSNNKLLWAFDYDTIKVLNTIYEFFANK